MKDYKKILEGLVNIINNTEKSDIGFANICTFIGENCPELKESDLDEVKIGETQIYIEDDGGEPPYDGKQWLDLVCLEYEIPKGKFKDGDNV